MTQQTIQTILLNSLLQTLAVIVGFVVFGLLLNGVTRLLVQMMANAVGGNAAYFIANRLTFPGVVVHESAHALFAAVTGARVDEVNLFRPQNGTLGEVRFSTRGGYVQQAFQATMSAIAPVLCGSLMLVLIGWGFVNSPALWLRIVLVYLFVSVLLHTTMSWQDVRCAVRGLPFCMLIGYALLVAWNLCMELGWI